MDPVGDYLERARQETGMTMGELWLRYFALGGMTAALEMEAAVHGALTVSDDDRDRIVHALNERLIELGHTLRVPYARDGEATL